MLPNSTSLLILSLALFLLPIPKIIALVLFSLGLFLTLFTQKIHKDKIIFIAV